MDEAPTGPIRPCLGEGPHEAVGGDRVKVLSPLVRSGLMHAADLG